MRMQEQIGKEPETNGVRPAGISPETPGQGAESAVPAGRIGEEEIREAARILQEYKRGKANLEARIIDNEQWWKLRHWEQIRKNTDSKPKPEPVSAWLFNSIANKHADAMDNFPEPSVLPREEGDREDAKALSSILPVVLEENGYEQTYSDKWWYKLKAGTGVEGVFWNPRKLGGLGDIEIKRLDLLSLFWEPGIQDIQQSRNLFHVELTDNDLLEQRYPELRGRLGTATIDVAKYVYDDAVDTSRKSAVVDWYYKLDDGGKTRLHYCKFVNDSLLYASENDPNYQQRGFYDHGEYPFVFDTLFVEEGMPTGFGYIDIMKSPQLSIDKLNQVILQNALMSGKKRFFVRGDGSVNEEEFADWSRDFVHVQGNLGEDSIREIETRPLDSIVASILQLKIDELKETSGNRDFSQGGTTSGVTAASAIAALQEAGSKLSRDMIKSSYRAFTQVCTLCVELIRQFYDEPRQFRILGERGAMEFIQYSNAGIRPQAQGTEFGVDLGYRLPVFDIKIRSQKSNPFSKLSQNEMAKEFFSMGFFRPDMADQALACMEMMDFEGRDSVMQRIAQNGTLFQMVQQLQQQVVQLAAIVDAQNGTALSSGAAAENLGEVTAPKKGTGNRVETNALGAAVQSTSNISADTARQRAMNVARPE